MGIAQQVNYFLNCYQLDNARDTIWDIFGGNVRDTDVLYGGFPDDWQDINFTGTLNSYFKDHLAKSLQLFKREKTLVVASHFIVGNRRIQAYGKTHKKPICAPLFIYDLDALILDQATGDFRLNLAAVRVNKPLLVEWMQHRTQYDDIAEAQKQQQITQLVQALLQPLQIKAQATGQMQVGQRESQQQGQQKDPQQEESQSSAPRMLQPAQLIERLEAAFDTAITIKHAGSLLTKNSLAATAKACQPGDYQLYDCLGFSLLPRPSSSPGIVHELELLKALAENDLSIDSTTAAADSFSKPLQALLGNTTVLPPAVPQAEVSEPLVPGVLSEAQQDILQQAAVQSMSILQGPPGTGKSYTIAAAALDRVAHGESVLIVSGNEHAVNVVQHKLVDDFGLDAAAVVRAGAKHYHRDLLKNLKSMQQVSAPSNLPGTALSRWYQRWQGERAWRRLRKQLQRGGSQLIETLQQADAEGQDLQTLQRDAQALTSSQMQRLQRAKQARQQSKQRAKTRQSHGASSDTDAVTLLQEHWQRLQDLRECFDQELKQRIQQRFDQQRETVCTQHYEKFTAFQAALRARTSHKQSEYFAATDIQLIIQSMPVWLCSLDALHKVLPLQPELFDLVIIDEATQCDIASCLPALQRAKRALIVGDSKQLRHVSFLSRKQQARVAERCDLLPEQVLASYRDDSILDLVNRHINNPVTNVMLDEHYRCHPDIIRYSNQHFYAGKLRVMTQRPSTLAADSDSAVDRAIKIVRVPDGQREKKANPVEARAILKQLRQQVDEQRHVPAEHKLSLGILCFFRDQAEYIQQALMHEFSLEEMTAHQLRCGTAYAFQGEERDVMLISCTVDAQSTPAMYTYMNRHDVFNVGITRARQQQWLFMSLAVDELPEKSLLRYYCDDIAKPVTTYLPEEVERNQLLDEFCMALHAEGMQTLVDYPIAGFTMDVVAYKNGHSVAIDLVGFPGDAGRPMQLERYRVFERAGLTIIPVSLMDWLYDQAAMLKHIRSVLFSRQELAAKHSQQQAHFSQHWLKLQVEHPDYAARLRILETQWAANPSLPKQAELLLAIGAMVDQFCRVGWVLNQVLTTTELTYIRYRSAAENLLLSCLESAETTHRQMLSAGNQKPGQAAALTLLEKLQQATQALNDMAVKWSAATDADSEPADSFEAALQDLSMLNENIENYL